MLQQQLSSKDKLLQTCLVKLERIEVFTCGICHAVYCNEERLTRHLATHVKCEDTLVYNTESTMRDVASRCATYKKQSGGYTLHSLHSKTRQPYISIRDRIMFESESEDSLSDTEILENSVMCLSLDSAPLSTDDHGPANEDKLKNQLNTTSSSRDVLNKNRQGTRSQYRKEKKSKPTPVSGKHVFNKRFEILIPCDTPRKIYTSKLIHKGQVTIPGGTDNCDQQFGFQTGHEQIQVIKQYSCNVCSKSFLTKSRLHAHLKIHSLDKTFKCEICEKKFMFKHQLKVHQRLHNNERPYSCRTCNTSFRHYSSLSHHKRSAHANLNDLANVTEQPTCAICNKRFSQKSAVLQHIYKYHMTVGYPCSVCSKEFGHPVARDWHMNIHKGTFKCSVCKKCYEKNAHLYQCELSHKKPFRCSYCNMKFGRKYHLARHLNDSCKRLCPNLREKLFKCQNCNKMFLRKDYVTQHLKLYCKPKPHECARCKIRFSGSVKNHNTKCKWKKYECDQCKKKFGIKKWMARHITNSICRKKLR